MFSIKTVRQFVRVPHTKVPQVPGGCASNMPYVVALELASLLKEGKTPNLADIWKADTTFTFTCTDGPYECPAGKQAMARHFYLIDGFITDRPQDDTLPVPYPMRVVQATIEAVFLQKEGNLLTCLPFLHLLTPKSGWTYVENFSWEGVSGRELQEVSDLFTSTELIAFTQVNEHKFATRSLASYLPPVPKSPGSYILSSLPQACLYCNSDEVAACEVFTPSFVFACQAIRGTPTSYVLNQSFDDEAGVLTDCDMIGVVQRGMYAGACSNDLPYATAVRAATILGLRAPYLCNMDAEFTMPYQLVPDPQHLPICVAAICSRLTSSPTDWQELHHQLTSRYYDL